MVKNKEANLIDTYVDKFLGGQTGKGRRRRRKQRGRVVTDLLKGGIKECKAVKDLIKEGMKGGIKQLSQLLKQGTRGIIRSGDKEGVKTGLKKGAQDLVKEGTRQAIQSAAQV